jgi:hypothetical protein
LNPEDELERGHSLSLSGYGARDQWIKDKNSGKKSLHYPCLFLLHDDRHSFTISFFILRMKMQDEHLRDAPVHPLSSGMQRKKLKQTGETNEACFMRRKFEDFEIL